MQFNLMQFLEWKDGATERLNYWVICMSVFTLHSFLLIKWTTNLKTINEMYLHICWVQEWRMRLFRVWELWKMLHSPLRHKTALYLNKKTQLSNNLFLVFCVLYIWLSTKQVSAYLKVHENNCKTTKLFLIQKSTCTYSRKNKLNTSKLIKKTYTDNYN